MASGKPSDDNPGGACVQQLCLLVSVNHMWKKQDLSLQALETTEREAAVTRMDAGL